MSQPRRIEVTDPVELEPTCRPGEHTWRLVAMEPHSAKLQYQCTRCGAKKVEQAKWRKRPTWDKRRQPSKKKKGANHENRS